MFKEEKKNVFFFFKIYYFDNVLINIHDFQRISIITLLFFSSIASRSPITISEWFSCLDFEWFLI